MSSSYKRHRRYDSYIPIQSIIKEREKEQEKIKRFSYPPSSVVAITEKLPSQPSVRFTTDPPKIYRYVA